MSVHWTSDERELVIEAMAERLRKEPRVRFRELWEAGNELLASDRRRKFFSAYSSVVTNPVVGGLFVEARKRASTLQEPMPGKAHIPLQQETPVTWVPVPTPAPERTVEDFSFEVLLTEVVKRLLDRFAPPVYAGNRAQDGAGIPPGVLPKAVTTAPEVLIRDALKMRPVRIALCGPMADQFRRVKERINARKVELVWVDNQKTVTEQDFSRGLDHVIVTRFIRHAHTELAQQSVGKDRVHWTSQGTESIVTTVSGIVPGCVN